MLREIYVVSSHMLYPSARQSQFYGRWLLKSGVSEQTMVVCPFALPEKETRRRNGMNPHSLVDDGASFFYNEPLDGQTDRSVGKMAEAGRGRHPRGIHYLTKATTPTRVAI